MRSGCRGCVPTASWRAHSFLLIKPQDIMCLFAPRFSSSVSKWLNHQPWFGCWSRWSCSIAACPSGRKLHWGLVLGILFYCTWSEEKMPPCWNSPPLHSGSHRLACGHSLQSVFHACSRSSEGSSPPQPSYASQQPCCQSSAEWPIDGWETGEVGNVKNQSHTGWSQEVELMVLAKVTPYCRVIFSPWWWCAWNRG